MTRIGLSCENVFVNARWLLSPAPQAAGQTKAPAANRFAIHIEFPHATPIE
jgi:hypothetical protein